MKNQITERQSLWHIVKNNIWVIKFVVKYAPSLIVDKFFKIPISVLNTFISINFTRWIIERIDSRIDLNSTILFIVGICSFFLITNLLLAISNIVIVPQKQINLSSKIREDLINKVGKINQIEFQSKEFFNTYILGLNEIDVRASQVLDTVFSILTSICNMIVITGVTAEISNGFAFFGIAAALIDVGVGVVRQKYNYKQTIETTPDGRRRGYINRITYQAEFTADLKIYPLFTRLLIGKYKKATSDVKRVIFKFSKIFLLIDQLQQVPGIILRQMLPWIYIVVLLSHNQISIAEVTVLATSALTIPTTMITLMNSTSSFYVHSLYIENLRKIFNYKEDIEKDSGITLDAKTSISFQINDISFAYSSEDRNVIDHVSMKINNGDKIAIVGYNGAGKTTLVKLLIRLYDLKEGHIYINNKNIIEINAKSLRSKTVLLSQDFKIYSFSIAENILMRPVFGDDDIAIVEDALKKVGLYNKISTWKQGIHTNITCEFDENGKYLSGGEMQKLSLARVYAGNYDCIILDESTGSLDPVSEDEIIQTIFNLFKDKTIIMISHRLATVKYVDRICFMKEGHLIEQGTHQELMSLGGEYSKFYLSQADKFCI